MLGRIRYYLFLLIVFFISSQVGLHFWPEFAYVNGIRIDYLSPTLYLLDILIVAWILITFKIGLKFKEVKLRGNIRLLILLFVISLLWNIFAAKSVGAHVFGIVKLCEFVLFGFLVAKSFKGQWISGLVRTLSLSAILSSILAIWQFLEKGSIGGLWYFWGERTFSITTVGISTVNLDHQILRPYGAFPHPNLLAFFLFTSIVFAVERLKYEKKWWRVLLLSSIIISFVAVVLTFSRVVIILLVCYSIYEIYTKVSPKLRAGALRFFQIAIPLLLIFALNKYSTFILRGVDFRQELFAQSYEIFKSSAYFGIGLNNFFVNQAPLIHMLSPTNFQPPHNMFVVALLSLGLIGFLVFPAGIFIAFRWLFAKLRTTNYELRTFYKSVLIVLVGVVVAGMFDHFFLTLEQGQIMFALVLGLAFSNIFFPEVFKHRKSKSGK